LADSVSKRRWKWELQRRLPPNAFQQSMIALSGAEHDCADPINKMDSYSMETKMRLLLAIGTAQ
jgi:hypothetical protein